jgi:hypothetical protein
MKQFALLGMCVAVLAIGITGCDWDTGTDAESWSSSYDWVNFSGVYRGSVTTTLDPDYTPASTSTMHQTETFLVAATLPFAEGKTARQDLVPGQFTISINGASFSDPDKDGNLTGNGSGVVNYGSGAWSISFPGFEGRTTITGRISYSYYDITEESGTEFGSTEVDAYSFTVAHTGENLSMVDNTGSRYAGRITKLSSASGAQNTDIGQVGADEEGNDSARYTY